MTQFVSKTTYPQLTRDTHLYKSLGWITNKILDTIRDSRTP
jgi:hypothetical protein